jgi:hypothetical protein
VATVSAERSGSSGIMSPMPNGTEAGAATSIAEGAHILLHDPAFRDSSDLHSNQVARNTATPVHDEGMAAEFPPLPSTNQFSHAVTGPLNVLTQVAAAQGTAGGSASSGKVKLKVTPLPSRAGTPAGIFIPAELQRLFEAHGVEIWVHNRERDLGETTAGEPDR